MSSSIFSSEYITAYRGLPRRTRLWHGALALGSMLTVLLCSEVLCRTFADARLKLGNAKILCVGSSRVRDGLKPGVFRWPLGKLVYPALDQATATASVKAHLDQWPELEVVLIGLDEFSLLVDAVELHGDDLSDVCGSLDVSSLALNAQTDGEAWFARHVCRWRNFLSGTGSPSLHHRRRLSIVNTLPALVPSTVKRHNVRMITVPAAVSRVRLVQRAYISSNTPIAVRRNTEALVELVAILQSRGISAVLLCLPCSKAYESQRPPNWDRLVDRALARVRTELGEHACTVWDYRGDARATDDWFVNVDHLGSDGRQRFSALLDARLADEGLMGPRATPR